MSEHAHVHATGSPWVLGLCSVLFDLDVGQKVEDVYPPGILATEEEGQAVAFHCFPDSMSFELHARSGVRDSTFFFRIRQHSAEPIAKSQDATTTNGSLLNTQHYEGHQASFLYGFVFCRQRQDPSLRRGGEQRSVVVLARHPYSSVLMPLSQYAGQLLFNSSTAALKQVYEEVLEWPFPEVDERCMLQIGHNTLVAQVPAPSTLPPPSPPEALDQHGVPRLVWAASPVREEGELMQGAFFEVDVWTPLAAVVGQAWALWELVVLAQPLLVLAPSPGECTAAVAALLALITPLPYSADFRPYFTIHDPDFAALAAGGVPSSSDALPRLLGVTNMYFIKALPGWPNVLSVGVRPAAASTQPASSAAVSPVSPSAPAAAPSRLQRLNPNTAVKALRWRVAGASSLLQEHTQRLWAAQRPLCRPDHALLERLAQPSSSAGPEAAARMAAANSAALRRHFNELTVALLAPFEPYLRPQGPPPGDAPVPQADPPALPAFSHAEFLAALPTMQLAKALLDRFPTEVACTQFYQRFLQSPNFTSWFERRRAAAWQWQQAAWNVAIAARGMGPDPRTMDEVALVGLFFDLEQRLQSLAQRSGDGGTAGEQEHELALRRRLGQLFQAMPSDLQQTLLSSPQRAAMLHGLPSTQARLGGTRQPSQPASST